MTDVADETFLRWQEWIEELDRPITMLHYRRILWRGTTEMIQAHELDDGHFLTFLSGLYVDAQAMGIRRLATGGDDVISLHRLLNQILEHPSVISRERFLRYRHLQGGENLDVEYFDSEANAVFDEWADDRGRELNSEIVVFDLATLESQVGKVVKFATRTVAHLDRRGFDDALTFGEMNDAVTQLGELHARYYRLLTGRVKGQIAPTIQGDWRQPFRRVLTGSVDEDDTRLDY